MQMVRPTVVHDPREINGLSCPTAANDRVENKGHFCGMSNRANGGPDQTETAAPTGIGSGGKSGNQASSTSHFYHGLDDATSIAATWYAENRENCPRPIIVTLRSMFGLSAMQAVRAVQVVQGVRSADGGRAV